jgi:DNA-binding NarL/FixJ family response regulator
MSNNIEKRDFPTRVVVVDDDESIRLWFKEVLQPAKNFNLTGSFSNATEALEEIPRLQADVTLMDIRLPGLNGVECAKRLKRVMPRLKIIMVTGTHEEHYIGASLQAGAAAFLIKPLEVDQLLATLRFAAKENEIKVNSENEERLSQLSKPYGVCLLLSSREKEVLSGLAEGLLYKEISHKLGISYTTVHKYQHNIFKKLGVSNRSEAIRIWLDGQSA